MSTIASIDETGVDNNYALYSGAIIAAGEVFQAGAGATLTSGKFYLKKSGSPPGNFAFFLYSVSGTPGTDGVPNNLLATSGASAANSLTTAYQLVELSFGTPYTCVLNNFYALVIAYNAGDSSNLLHVGTKTTVAAPANYNFCRQAADTTWLGSRVLDCTFYAIHTDPPSGDAPPPFNPWLQFGPILAH